MKHHFGVDFSSRKVRLPEGYTLMNGQILKYNSEVNDVYFGKDFYASGGEVKQIDKLREILIDNVVLNLSTKDIKTPVNDDASVFFAKALKEEIKDKKLLIKNNEQGNKCLFADGVQILEIKEGNIIALNFPNVTEINNFFMYRSNYLKSVNMPNLQKMGNYSLCYAGSLISFDAPNLREIGNNCFRNARSLTSFEAPSLQEMGFNCLNNVKLIASVNMPKHLIPDNIKEQIAENKASEAKERVSNLLSKDVKVEDKSENSKKNLPVNKSQADLSIVVSKEKSL